jgi:superfamily II DNA or RNA helicase
MRSRSPVTRSGSFRAPGEPDSLRRPQLGALHSALGYWTSGLADPGIIVMPTGTGKTETMLALLVAARLGRLLVIVATTALRSQIAAKFETLGVLQQLGVVGPSALRPVVGRLEHGIPDAAAAERFAAACNVVVATPAAVEACAPEALGAFYSRFTHLMVDEAHHAPAATWHASSRCSGRGRCCCSPRRPTVKTEDRCPAARSSVSAPRSTG